MSLVVGFLLLSLTLAWMLSRRTSRQRSWLEVAEARRRHSGRLPGDSPAAKNPAWEEAGGKEEEPAGELGALSRR